VQAIPQISKPIVKANTSSKPIVKTKKLKHIKDPEVLKEIDKVRLENKDPTVCRKLIKEIVNNYNLS
jgi:hypothetical protein